MLNLEQIKRRLADRQLVKVSEATGIHYNTLKTIRDKESANPAYSTMLALSEYFKSQEK